MCQMKASLINIQLTSTYSAGSYAFLSKDFAHYSRRSRSGQVHSFMAALTCLRSVETNLTLTCSSPKSFVCNLPDSGRHLTTVFQGLSLSRSVGRCHSVLGIPAFWASPSHIPSVLGIPGGGCPKR